RAQQLTAIDPDWNCPWPLDWQRHHRILAQLAADEPGGLLPAIEPGVTFDGDDLGRWLTRQTRTWTQLSTEQQQLLTALGVTPAQTPSPAPVAAGGAKDGTAKGSGKAQQAFQRGLAALTQWVEREGADRPVPRGHAEPITIDGETEPVTVTVKLGVWISNTKARRNKLDRAQLAALTQLGADWAR
ncbi:helicase associated domain-containing protein, partial [Streptomyces sp. H27-S2]|uniref:helicase associated domain-containing protein n=1 Tax=Streptomyces antarcticus TaxID=2996458 RepID=UPI00226F1161